MRSLPVVARETPRERVLSDAEIQLLLRACARLDAAVDGRFAHYAQAWSAFVRLLLLTGQRRGEVAGLRWTEIVQESPGNWVWQIPSSRTKNGRTHLVHLSPQAVAVIQTQRSFGINGFVLSPGSKNALSGFGKIKARLDRLIAADIAACGDDQGMSHWTWHDLRRTCATGLQRLGVRLEVTEAVLNHVSGARSGIVGVYQRHQWTVEKRTALNLWAGHVDTLDHERGELAPSFHKIQ